VTVHPLVETARLLVADGRGLLAMDESQGTCDKRFAAAGIAVSEAARRSYRELLITAPGLRASISGAILYDETIRQSSESGVPFVTVLADAGIIPGIKVDTGAQPLALHDGEMVTEGLDGLRERLRAYYEMGARFAKWRAVISLQGGAPTTGCLDANAHALARYAALCQEAGLVPIVEPEVLMEGDHTLAQCRDVTEATLRRVFNQLARQRVMFEGMILKPNMVLPGLDCPVQESVAVVAETTVTTLLRVVPACVPGIAFLSGGQSGELAAARLNEMNLIANRPEKRVPWRLTFSFSRAIQFPALEIWHGNPANKAAAQRALVHRANCNLAALSGTYGAAMENRPTLTAAAA
jgi:fructose-bisphosphate aldolase class I